MGVMKRMAGAGGRGGPRLDFKARFFFDLDGRPLQRGLDRAARQNLSRAGAFVRRTARRLLRPARQKRINELGPEELQQWRIRQAVAKREGRRPPRRPLAASRPGEPPRLRSAGSPLKRLLFFGYDAATRSVVIGPERFGSRPGAHLLEHGGRGRLGPVAARPFMRPALRAELEAGTIPKLWRNSVRTT